MVSNALAKPPTLDICFESAEGRYPAVRGCPVLIPPLPYSKLPHLLLLEDLGATDQEEEAVTLS